MNALIKDFFRGMAKNKGKFISVFFIILLGAAFFSGLRSSRGDMLLSAERYYDDSALMDLKVMSEYGLTEKDAENISSLDGVDKAVGGWSLDVVSDTEDNKAVKLISYSDEVNLPDITEGRLPENDGECLLDSFFADVYGFSVGDTFAVSDGGAGLGMLLSRKQFTVSGLCNLPYYMDLNRGTGTVGNGELDGFAVVMPEVFSRFPVYTEISVTVSGAAELDSFGDKYEGEVEKAAKKIEELSDGQWYVLDRGYIASCVNYENDAERINSLSGLLPIIFFLVAALVSLNAMTRLVEEERPQIGTLKALGCGDGTVLFRYLAYALIPAFLGAVAGVLLGEKIFPLAIMNAYSLLYTGLPNNLAPYNIVQGVIAVAASVLCTGLATVFACFKISREKPAQIMRPEAPKAGKRVLLERVPFVWKHLSFTQKATVRNMFRYKRRFLMTVIGVAGCMGLVMVGLGLHDSIIVVADKQFEEITHYQAAVTYVDGICEEQKEDIILQIEEKDPDISAVEIYSMSVDAESAESVQTLSVTVPRTLDSLEDFFTFRGRTSRKSFVLGDDGALISEKTATSLGVKAGDELTVGSGASKKSVKIAAVYENYIGHYLFISPSLCKEVFGAEPQYNQLILRYADNSDAYENELGSFLLSLGGVQGVNFVSTTVKWADDTLSSLNTIVLIVLAAAALLAFVVLYNLNSINIAERKRELATLKVLGFRNREVAAYVYKENMLLTILGIVFGIFVGILLHSYVIKSIEVDLIMFGRTIAVASFFIGAAITLGFSILVNLIMYRSLKKIDMVESLKSVE